VWLASGDGHARRKFCNLVRLNQARIAIEAVARIDALFAIGRDINGLPPGERHQVRHERGRPRVEALGIWLGEQQARLSLNSQVAKAIASRDGTCFTSTDGPPGLWARLQSSAKGLGGSAVRTRTAHPLTQLAPVGGRF
jgi:hypothetical protein